MEKFLKAFHVADIFQKSPLEAVRTGFLAWALLALSMGIIFLVVLIVNKAIKSKASKKNND